MTIEAITAAASQGSEWAMPSIEPLGPEAQIEAGAGADAVGSTSASSFGDALTKAVGQLNQSQVDAATEAQKLATGQTNDLNSVVMAAERAQLSMQLAATVRDKSVAAINDILRTQV